MAQYAAFQDMDCNRGHSLEADRAIGIRRDAKARLAEHPCDPEILLRLLHAELALRDKDAARASADALAQIDPISADALDAVATCYLLQEDYRAARTVVATAEEQGHLPKSAIARVKARIAGASGDLEAATAILVMAIEAEPDNPPLRTLLAEVLMAGGSASHARDVLMRLGQPPAHPSALRPKDQTGT